MFTKDDYRQYFKTVSFAERQMIYSVEDLVSRINDKAMMVILGRVAQDELRHYRRVIAVTEPLILKDEVEKRAYVRENWLGTVDIERAKDKHDIDGKCVNISEGGICVETNERLVPGEEVGLSVNFYGKEEERRHRGHLVWSDEVEPGHFIAGIKFK